jgi:hypothetical protein
MHRLCDAICNRTVGQKARDENALAGEKCHVISLRRWSNDVKYGNMASRFVRIFPKSRGRLELLKKLRVKVQANNVTYSVELKN